MTARRLLPFAVLAALLAAALTTGGADAATRAVTTTTDDKFSPATITIVEEDIVEWTHGGGNTHTVTADDGSFDSHPNCPSEKCFESGEKYRRAFSTPGTFRYYCKLHGGMNGQGMSGIVNVTQATPSPTTAATASPTGSPAPTSSPGVSPSPTPTATPTATPSPTATPRRTLPPIPSAPPSGGGSGQLTQSAGQASDNTVVRGQKIEVSGGGFAPNRTLDIQFQSQTTNLGQTQSSAGGTYRVTITVPTDATPGSHRVVVAGPNPGGGTHASITDVTVVAGRLPATGVGGGLPRAIALIVFGALLCSIASASRRGRAPVWERPR